MVSMLANSPFLNPQMMIPILISYVILFAIAVILLFKDKMNKKVSIVILLASIIVPGFILGSGAHPVFAFQQVLLIMSNAVHNPNTALMILPTMIVFLVILMVFTVSTLIFGRTFCSYVCPLGSVQELTSKLIIGKKVKKHKYVIEIPEKFANYFRLCIFIGSIVLTLIWSFALFSIINPFNAFTISTNILNLQVILIPIILFIIILVSSVFVYRPWCRLLCPFGTIAWLTSRFSIFKLRRTDKCIQCKACEKVCPTGEAFEDSKKSECYQCMRCVDICPSDAIKYKKK